MEVQTRIKYSIENMITDTTSATYAKDSYQGGEAAKGVYYDHDDINYYQTYDCSVEDVA